MQATLSDILRQLGKVPFCVLHFYIHNLLFYLANCIIVIYFPGIHFSVDLMHRKAEVKAIITDVINNMTDEEDEGDEEAEENAEAGDASDKDEEKDGDDKDDDDA